MPGDVIRFPNPNRRLDVHAEIKRLKLIWNTSDDPQEAANAYLEAEKLQKALERDGG